MKGLLINPLLYVKLKTPKGTKTVLYNKIFILIILINFKSTLYPQSIGGTEGLLLTPTARMPEDGSFTFGCAYINTDYLHSLEDNVFATYGSVMFLPFLEIGLRINTWIHPEKGFYYEGHVGDRMPVIRTRLLNENNSLPSLVLGLQDFSVYSTTNKASNFHSTYLVFSKKYNSADLHIGYGFDFINANAYQFIGIFGGIDYRLNQMIRLCAEHDSHSMNIGVKLLFFKSLRFVCALQQFKKYSMGLSYRLNLKEFSP